jgi:hypothetical protein
MLLTWLLFSSVTLTSLGAVAAPKHGPSARKHHHHKKVHRRAHHHEHRAATPARQGPERHG